MRLEAGVVPGVDAGVCAPGDEDLLGASLLTLLTLGDNLATSGDYIES